MEAAKRERDIAAKELNDVIRQAQNYIGAPNPNVRLLQQRITRIEDRELHLRDCHYKYLDKAKIAIDDETESDYLTALTDKALDCTDQCLDLITSSEETTASASANNTALSTSNTPSNSLNTPSEPDHKTRCKQIKREIAIDEKFAEQLVVKLNEIIDSPDVIVKDIIGSVKSHDDKLCETLSNLDKSWKSLIANIDSDDEDAESTRIITKRMQFQSVHTKVVELIENHRTTSEVARLTEQVETASVTHESIHSDNSRSKSNNMVRPEKMKNPVFSGDIRHYANFKKEFKQIVQPHYPDQTNQVYVIKSSCLVGEPKSLVKNLDDLDLIWKRLDDKYGDKLDLVEVVIKELEDLPAAKHNEDTKFIRIVDTLEKGLLDLDAIGARDEIANLYTVKLLENKISCQMYLVWLEKFEEAETKASETTSSETIDESSEDVPSKSPLKVNKFKKLYEFLLSERKRRMKLMKRISEKPKPPPPPPPPSRHNANGAINKGLQQTQKCLLHPNANHFTRKCNGFRQKTVEERAALINEKKACHLCLGIDHVGQPCPRLATWSPCNHSNCGKPHSHLLHEAEFRGLLMCLKAAAVSFTVLPTSTSSTISTLAAPNPPLAISTTSATSLRSAVTPSAITSSPLTSQQSASIPSQCLSTVDVNSTLTMSSASASHHNINVLLLIQRIDTRVGTPISTFFDNGSTLSLVSRSYVVRNNLKGVRISYELTTVGGVVTTQYTYLHNIELVDSNDNSYTIQAFEIVNICGSISDIDVSNVVSLFSGITLDDVRREFGDVELLVGMKHAAIHPKQIQEADGLVLYESKFGTNRVLGGTHKFLQETDCLDRTAATFAHAQVDNVRVMFDTDLDCGIDFFTSEDFGVKLVPNCDECKTTIESCRTCTYDVHMMSKEERRELNIIENNLKLDPTTKTWTTQYPYKVDPAILDNNEQQAESLAISTENRLIKTGTLPVYNEVYHDLVERGVLEILSEREKAEYKGPIFHTSHHEVYKESSSSTPIRIVMNSSLIFNGHCYNEILYRGPNTLNDIYGVQLCFRSYRIAVVCDISKLYHSIRTTEREKHLRRVKWRDGKRDQPFATYGTNVVQFGDKPAAAIASVALRKTATLYRHIHEEAAKKIIKDSYVDDIVTGVEDDDVAAADSLEQGITDILLQGNFHHKGFVRSGCTSKEVLKLLGSGEVGRILGCGWDPTNDVFRIVVRINFSKKLRNGRAEPDLDYASIPSILNMLINLRLLLSFVNSCYEPMGLTCPITVQLKIPLRNAHRNVFNKLLGWDDDIGAEAKGIWVEVIQRVKQTESVTFKRCVKPPNAIGSPILILCSDGSEQAMCAAAYIRWKCSDGSFRCRLWTAKTRVTSLKKSTMPRIEMQAAVMAVRLSEVIKLNSIWQFEKVIHIIDSMCTLATLRKETTALRPYMGHRVAECLDTTKTSQWFAVKSADNISDLGTRMDATVKDIDENSEWQNGSRWMSLSIEKWPVTQDIGSTKVPEEEVLIAKFCAHIVAQETVLDYNKFIGRSYQFVKRLTAVVLKIAQTHTFTGNAEITPNFLRIAEHHMLLQSMRLTQELLNAGKLQSLRPEINKEGIIVLRSRAAEGLRVHYDNTEFPILAYKDPIAYLWIKLIHDEDHGGNTKVVAKARRKFWIIRAAKLAEKIRRSCYDCRLKDKHLAQQLMAPLPTTRVVMSPTFCHISLDVLGPYFIKDTVKQRTKKKVWGVILNCTVTRAIHLDITEDYGADSFLITFRKFVSLRGCPSTIYYDQGSQIVAASEEFKSWSASKGIDLQPASAEGQHQNGASESLIKSVKKSLSHVVGPNVHTFSGLQMVFYEVANIVNSRPIGIISGSDPCCPDPITPNHLILGRSTPEVATGPFDETPNVNKRYEFLQTLVNSWWNRWYQSVLPSLVPCYKWLQRHRNVQIGDVCLIRYKNDLRATYRLGQVVKTKPGTDGLVRKVVLKYKLPNEKVYRLVDRPIHGISVIVPVEEQSSDETVDAEAVDSKTSKGGLNPHAVEYLPQK